MTEPLNCTNEHEGIRRAGLRAALFDVRDWTGRSAMISATSTTLPHIATAGTRRTRVSEMRSSAPGTARREDALGLRGRRMLMRRCGDAPPAGRG